MGRAKRSHVLLFAATAVAVCLVAPWAKADNEFFPEEGAVDDQALAELAGTLEDESEGGDGKRIGGRSYTDGSRNASFHDPSTSLVQSERPPLSAGALAVLQDLGISVPQ